MIRFPTGLPSTPSRVSSQAPPRSLPQQPSVRRSLLTRSLASILQARYHLDLADRFADNLGYGPAVRLKPFRPHLTVGALSCALQSQRAQNAPTARTLKTAGAHPGGFPHRRPSPAPIEP